MSLARVGLKQDGVVYRFLALEAKGDGSIYIWLDQNPRNTNGSLESNEQGELVPILMDKNEKLPYPKLSVHTTGTVNFHTQGRKRSSFFLEPLFALTKISTIGFFSIPSISRLDKLDCVRSTQNSLTLIDFEDSLKGRVTFEVSIGSKSILPDFPCLALTYELYSVFLSQIDNFSVPDNASEHFVCCAPKVADFHFPLIDKENAELKFNQCLHGEGIKVFWNRANGEYTVMATRPMRAAPNLTIVFDKDDLTAEVISIQGTSAPSHKVKFWIRDKGGRNKKNDLRKHIIEFALESEL